MGQRAFQMLPLDVTSEDSVEAVIGKVIGYRTVEARVESADLIV